ncbi:MAG: hypothetical protein JRJ73_09685 [Deltaproteobacteria bacterium]|nr:hypothetical protein [Deltaproteobacteria bacterium]
MPIYEYECEAITCPKCECGKTKKLMSTPAAIDSGSSLLGNLGSVSNAGGSCGSGGFS